ncbi:Pro-Pol polyprotein [Trichinella sp. T8]|nr:Pro-Pol polyprotein [Trichinella sp. T8]
MPAYIHTDFRSSFTSNNLKTYLHSLGVVTSRTTTHNPQGNGEAERYNGVMWKAVTLALNSHNLRIEQWEEVIGLALHSIRTLRSSATNSTPHEHLFGYSRRTPTVEEVELLEASPKYAHVRLTYGRESVRHLAPAGGKCVAEDGNPDETQVGTGAPREEGEKLKNRTLTTLPENSENEDTATRQEHHQTPPRRSTRIRRAIQRLQDYVQY